MDKFERLHLREWRLHKGLTGQQLAELSGITRSEVSRLEHGNRRLTMNHAKILADAMGILPEDLTRLPDGGGQVNSGFVRALKGDSAEHSIVVAGAKLQTKEPIRFVPTSSDEMTPTFVAGDYVAVDTSVTSLVGGGIYAVKMDGFEFIRRIQIIGKIAKLICDNDRYETVEMPISNFEITGKAVCVVKQI